MFLGAAVAAPSNEDYDYYYDYFGSSQQIDEKIKADIERELYGFEFGLALGGTIFDLDLNQLEHSLCDRLYENAQIIFRNDSGVLRLNSQPVKEQISSMLSYLNKTPLKNFTDLVLVTLGKALLEHLRIAIEWADRVIAVPIYVIQELHRLHSKMFQDAVLEAKSYWRFTRTALMMFGFDVDGIVEHIKDVLLGYY